jgi:hypothetical protein
MRPARKARGGRIPGVCNRRATPRPGMQRRPNVTGLRGRDTSARGCDVFVAIRIGATVLDSRQLPTVQRSNDRRKTVRLSGVKTHHQARRCDFHPVVRTASLGSLDRWTVGSCLPPPVFLSTKRTSHPRRPEISLCTTTNTNVAKRSRGNRSATPLIRESAETPSDCRA